MIQKRSGETGEEIWTETHLAILNQVNTAAP